MVIARIPPYVVVPSFKLTFGPVPCALAIRCAMDTVHRATTSSRGWHFLPSTPKCWTVHTPSAPEGKPVTMTSRRTYTADTMFSPPIVTWLPCSPVSPTPGVAALGIEFIDLRTADEGRLGGFPCFPLPLNLESGVMDLERFLPPVFFALEETADPGRDDDLDALANAAAIEILPSPVLGSPASAWAQSAMRRPSFLSPISPTQRTSDPTLTLRHTLMCLAPYVMNSSIPGKGFHTVP